MPIPADYIVEQGTSGIWTYRKWNSGIAECWGRYTSEENTTFSDVWDSNNINSTIIKTNYPFTFAKTPIENCKIVDGRDNVLVLDNGKRLFIDGNWGCSGCGSGNYYVRHLSTCNNAITNVEFNVKADDSDGYYQSYLIYVIADGVQTTLLDVYGSDGNGWYGTGYSIKVYDKKEEE